MFLNEHLKIFILVQLLATIDYDTVISPLFDFVIDVSDGPNTLTVTGRVIVTAVNEHTPSFSQSLYFFGIILFHEKYLTSFKIISELLFRLIV